MDRWIDRWVYRWIDRWKVRWIDRDSQLDRIL